LVDAVGWRWTFFINVPLGAALTVVVARNLRHIRPTGRRRVPDLIGVLLLATGVGSLALAIVKSNAWGIGSGPILGLFATAAVFLTALLVRSARHPDPIVYLPLFADPQFRRGTGLMLLLAGSFSAMFLTVIRTFTDGWGMSVAAAGAAAAVIPLFGGPLSLAAGRIADRRGSRAVIAPGAFVMTGALVLYATQLTGDRNVVGLWLPIGALYGIGVGFAHASCQAAAMRNVPAERLGVGVAMSRIAMDVGGVISVAVSVAVIDRAGDAIIGARRVAGLVAAVCAVGGLLALRLPDTTRRRAEP
jgi:MFS family permease